MTSKPQQPDPSIQPPQPSNSSPVMRYQPRDLRSKALPVLILIGLLFAIAVIGRSFDRMMTSEFLVLTPIVFGALINYMVNYQQPAHFGHTIKWLAICCAALVVFSILALREGSICVILALPILFGFFLCGAALMHLLCRYLWKPHKAVYSLAVLPLLLMFLPEQVDTTHNTIERSIVIDAPVSTVWQKLNHIEAINSTELKPSLVYTIGVPYPVSGITTTINGQPIRQSRWQKNIYFEEVIQQSIPNQYLRWNYRFLPDSVPEGALDDHVRIGGKYFDFEDTSYRLVPINAQQTRLILTIDYRVSTEINFYTVHVANVLLNDFARVILDLYKQRSEANNIT